MVGRLWKVTHLLSSQKNHVFKKGDNYDYSQVVIINSFCFFNCRLRIFYKNYAKISRIAKNELFMSFSPQQR